MFNDLKRIWAEQSYTQRIVDDFVSMLDGSEEMLKYALKVLRSESKGKKSEKKIYIKDQKINITEQEIKKRILVHLAATPHANLTASLMLISISKDAERIGDLVKNIFELDTLHDDSAEVNGLFTTLFFTIGDDSLALFTKVSEAFKESDVDAALEISAKARTIAKHCEEIIAQIAASTIAGADAVVLTLGAYYLKRIVLHLGNIAGSIYLPLPELDYIDDTI